MIIIKSLKIETPKEYYQIRVDRPNILGNPFKMINEDDRNTVCDLYEDYFYKRLQYDESFLKEVNRIFDIYRNTRYLELFCWCGKKRCHSFTIKNYLNKRLKGEINQYGYSEKV